MEPARNLDEAIAILCTLDDDVRRACYKNVRDREDPATRAEVAGAVGISAGLAGFHLDKLLAVGLLEADYRRPPGRGRGGGRPAKRYWASAAAIELALPPRRYDVVAAILAESKATGEDHRVIARRAGATLVDRPPGRTTASRRVRAALSDLGFHPASRGNQTVQRNCPFRAAQQAAPAVVCQLNQSLVEGLLAAAGDTRQAVLAPDGGRCCVVIRSSSG